MTFQRKVGRSFSLFLLFAVLHQGSMAAVPSSILAPDQYPMDWNDTRDFDFSSRGFIADRVDPLIRDESGRVVYDKSEGAFLEEPDPGPINPSLLRQARLLRRAGLFEVVAGVYQVRGFDITNITFVRGDTGWVVIDPLMTPATARAAYELVSNHLGQRPIKAVIYTHSHVDHFGGAAGVISQEDADAGKVAVIAPKGFLESTLTEFVVNGAAMHRRTEYAGVGILRGPEGTITSGLADAAARGPLSFIPPTREITRTGERLEIDGVELEFQLTPDTEALAEMNIYLPKFRVLDMAENANVTMHNVLSPRGVQVRNTKEWARQLTQSLKLFGERTDVVILSHGWPRFGQAEVVDYLSRHRDAYKFLHDQSVRMMNEGLLPDEIANRLELPESLAREWYNRSYYGSFSFNARAIYQQYLGWYQGNPVDLQSYEPAEESRRYVEAMGGSDRVMERALKSSERGDDRWAAELLNRVVMADSANQAARDQLADVHTRLALQQENGIWRAQYLSAAMELRDGVTDRRFQSLVRGPILEKMPTPTLFELLSVRLDPAKVGDESAEIDFVLPERDEHIRVSIRNQVMIHDNRPEGAAKDATVTLSRAMLASMIISQEIDPSVEVSGSRDAVEKFARWFTAPSGRFPIVWRPE